MMMCLRYLQMLQYKFLQPGSLLQQLSRLGKVGWVAGLELDLLELSGQVLTSRSGHEATQGQKILEKIFHGV